MLNQTAWLRWSESYGSASLVQYTPCQLL